MRKDVMARRTCNGTASSAAANAKSPRNRLFVATADDDRPAFESTMYASVLEYIHLRETVHQRQIFRTTSDEVDTYTEKRPQRKRKTQGAATCTRSCITQPYATIDGGRNAMPRNVD